MISGDFMLKGISLRGLLVMDAGTGAANTTLWLAQKLKEAGGARMISIDHNPETFPDAKKKLGELAEAVDFVNADLTSIPVRDGCIEMIVCHATMCAINDRPLRAVKALTEYFRATKKDGWLMIDDEYPLPKPSSSKEEVQVRRWQTYKALAELVEGKHYTEIYPEELEFVAKLVGFKNIEWKRFEGNPLTENVMNEWREVTEKMINEIEDEDLRTAFRRATERISEGYLDHGGVFPPYYVMRMKK